MTKAQVYKGQFSQIDLGGPQVPDKLNHMHNKYKTILENTLCGQFIFLCNIILFICLIKY